MAKVMFSTRLDSDIQKKFSEYCERVGLSQSQVVSGLVVGLMNGDIELYLDPVKGLVPRTPNREK